jgi:hypothetical protein
MPIIKPTGIRQVLYYLVKPFIPRFIQRKVRRSLSLTKRSASEAYWPIDPSAVQKPPHWSGWPSDRKFCFVLTHDVESIHGQRKCAELAAIEEEYGFRSGYGFVGRSYPDNPSLRSLLQKKGFEVYLHGIHHNGFMYASKLLFNLYAREINRIMKDWNIEGFRSPSMHRNLDWISELNMKYDASTFDTDPFEPLGEGLKTIFPLWVKNTYNSEGYVELPYTLPQDFTLFAILQEKSIAIWKQKIDWLAQEGGLILVITHPDYMVFNGDKCNSEQYPVDYYKELLEYVKTKYSGQYWHALPREVAHFWKQRYGL